MVRNCLLFIILSFLLMLQSWGSITMAEKVSCYKELLGSSLEKVRDENGWIPRQKQLTGGQWYTSSGDFHSFIQYKNNLVVKAKLKESIEKSIRHNGQGWEINIWAVFEDIEGVIEYKITGKECGANNHYKVVAHYK